MSDSEEEIKELIQKEETGSGSVKKEKAKKIMTEAMLLQLKNAREKAKQTHAIQSNLTKKKKVLSKLERMNEVLEIDKKITEKATPLIDAQIKNEVESSNKVQPDQGKVMPKKKVKYIVEESDSEEDEIVYVKKPKKVIKKKQKKVVYVSSDESESEEEKIEEQVVKKPSRKSQLREIELEKNRMMLEQQHRQTEFEHNRQRQILQLVGRLGLR